MIHFNQPGKRFCLRLLSIGAALLLGSPLLPPASVQAAEQAAVLEIPAKSCILVDGTGRVLYEDNADEQMPPASITKIMTLLLTFEALESSALSLDQTVTCSDYAASMGGTQIWLEPGEEMTLRDIIKACAVNSANDCAMVLAETVSGSESAFVARMNERAAELGMTGTHFENPTGLDADGHLSTARDIAIMSAELLRHEGVTDFTTIWMDSLRNGETGLVNTNKLVRYYTGCTGLKTGTTDGAGSCLSASATRDGVSLIAVSMGSATSQERFTACRTLLDYGFASFESYTPEIPAESLAPIPVTGGQQATILPDVCLPESVLIPKGKSSAVEMALTLSPSVAAPVQAGDPLGEAVFTLDGQTICTVQLQAGVSVDPIDFPFALGRLWALLLRKETA
jgi:D-alanyl-D-alanine carboxypeptidase (penicillin-binding protein 5/6)